MARIEKRYHFIYKTTNTLTGKYYIGMHSTDNLNDGYIGSGKRLRYSIKKYGKKIHKREILEFCLDRQELKEREEEIVNLDEIAKQDCMNLKQGGYGGFVSVEEQLKNSKKGIEKIKYLLENDKEWSENRAKNISISNKLNYKRGLLTLPYDWRGKKHTSETKKKMSDKAKERIGERNSQYGTCWVNKDSKNKKIKNSELKIYEKDGWEVGRVKINETKKIIQMDTENNTLNVFDSLKDANLFMGKSKKNLTIARACKGLHKLVYGYKWKYL